MSEFSDSSFLNVKIFDFFSPLWLNKTSEDVILGCGEHILWTEQLLINWENNTQ